MKITKNTLAAFAATFLGTLCLFANGQPKTFGKFPISLPSADSPAIKTRAYVVAAQPEDPQGLEAAAKSALSADVKSLGLSASDARRAMAFKKLARPDASKISATAKLGDFYAVFPAATRPGAHCAPLMHRALGTERQGVVRFSFGYFNTDEEVDTAIDALRDLAC